MYSYFAVVNTFSNAAGELVSERLFPEPYVWDDKNVPPMPTDPPPECFVPVDDGTPKYQAYVPKLAKPGWDQVNEKSNVCETCGCMKKHVRKPEAKWLQMSKEKAS